MKYHAMASPLLCKVRKLLDIYQANKMEMTSHIDKSKSFHHANGPLFDWCHVKADIPAVYCWHGTLGT